MCGIVARIGLQGILQRESLKHRGPDQINTFQHNNLWVEFSRLSITGGDSGKSPIISKDGRWVCFLNGEVYNYKALRNSFEIDFSESDTKILIEGVAKYGIEFLQKLRGMFAGMILDKNTNTVFIFRDALGEKPLFINITEKSITLSSEFTSMMKMLDRPLKLNPVAVSSYFRFGYAEEPQTFDLDVNSVARGHVYSINMNDLTLKSEFSLDGYDSNELDVPLNVLFETIYDEILYTEVKSGLALSGGIDSASLLVAKARRERIGFNPIIIDFPHSPSISEASEASKASSILGFHPIIANIDSLNISDDLQVLARFNDQPHADPSGLSYLKIFKTAHEHQKKIVFLGHGADELFWGYPWLFKTFRHKEIPAIIPIPNRFKRRGCLFWNTPGLTSNLLNSLAVAESKFRDFGSNDIFLKSHNSWERALALASHNYLSQNGLRQSDRLAMRFSIEPRTPYADSRLYGWAQTRAEKIAEKSFDKKEFRSALELGELEYLRKREKMGFRSEFDSWFKQDSLHEVFIKNLKKVSDLALPWKRDVSKLNLNPQEKYRILMLGLWLS